MFQRVEQNGIENSYDHRTLNCTAAVAFVHLRRCLFRQRSVSRRGFVTKVEKHERVESALDTYFISRVRLLLPPTVHFKWKIKDAELINCHEYSSMRTGIDSTAADYRVYAWKRILAGGTVVEMPRYIFFFFSSLFRGRPRKIRIAIPRHTRTFARLYFPRFH